MFSSQFKSILTGPKYFDWPSILTFAVDFSGGSTYSHFW